MKAFLIIIALGILTVPTLGYAADATCTATALEKKYAGAAKNSFMKKCEADTVTRCNSLAADKQLSGAAKNSYTKKCVTDGVGA